MTSSDASARLVEAKVQSEAAPLDLKPRPLRPATEVRHAPAPLRKSHLGLERPPFECVALLLQGGGALGAFQAGVYQGMAEANLHPDWVAGISIGAINAALIAGNAPETRLDKLQAFWDLVSTPQVPDLFGLADSWIRGDFARAFVNRLHASSTVLSGAPGFFTPRLPPPYLSPPGTLEATSWYDTKPLRSTLENLVDFDRINSGEVRFSVGTVNVRSGNFVFFDNTTHTIRP
jgi:NTE family protein